MNFDFELAKNSLPILIKASFLTLKISLLSIFIGFLLGSILAYLNSRNNFILSLIINFYVSLIQGTPMIIQIMFFYYLLPIIGIELSSFFASSIAIGLNSAAYMSQTIKSGISEVIKDQIDAAKTLGLTSFQIFRYIIFPQAIKYIFPSIGSECTTLIKDSSLASTIGVSEIFKESRQIINFSYDVFTIFILMSAFYLFLTSIVSLIFKILEKRLFKNVKN